MKWFKHFTDNHRGQSIQILLDELGHMGLCYFLLVEMCAEKLEPKVDQKLAEVDCEFNFHRRVVQQNLRIRPAALQRLLNCCATTGLLTFKLTGNSLQISMPILLDLLDSDSKKARSRRVQDAAKSRLDKDKDKDKDKEEEKEISAPDPCAIDPPFSPKELFDFWNENRGSLPEAKDLTEDRRKKAKAQLRKYPDKDHWGDVLAKFHGSGFCINDWKPGFDDFLREPIRIKALEDKYRNRRAATEPLDLAAEYKILCDARKSFGRDQSIKAREWMGEPRWLSIDALGGWRAFCDMPVNEWTEKRVYKAIKDSTEAVMNNSESK